MTWLARPFWEVRLGLENVLGLCMGKMVKQNYPPCGEDEKVARFTSYEYYLFIYLVQELHHLVVALKNMVKLNSDDYASTV